ncbi:cobyric acid synthase [Plebeiibacterium marinum]|uniref:Cobyric acid synthase n=1 Tax=Plebeiibacterium marinum TaxID=2992111 RepID=A0AAE3SKY7_9BACT|nr:cobyric acid synthase [Plebeiobacterium marinum]MCW3807023.1 cobyric acid synthase [Plebeiobacterium marinum]
MKRLKPIMFVGTGSDVGKSIINTAVCRILLQDGYSPAPYKAQNMSLNSYATPDGLEIGRAQAVQAEACGLECEVEMNPVLLKPTGDKDSQVVLLGKPIGNRSAKEYFTQDNNRYLFKEALEAFKTLESKYNPIVLEGAGSISELNLRERDIVNMPMAKAVGACTYLIADIDRGGVFASVYGSIKLLPEEERKLIKGIVINKFRGDMDLFTEGRKILEKITGVPVVAVIPYFRGITIEEEDSVSLLKMNKTAAENKVNVGVVPLRHMSNFTDFNRFAEINEVNLYFTDNIQELNKADILLLPGSKNTISDMKYLNETGLSEHLKNWHVKGKCIYGICGGYQIMGHKILDPMHIEGKEDEIQGLGILPLETTITKEKNSTQSLFQFRDNPESCEGYEIHMGETTFLQQQQPVAKLNNGFEDGFFKNERVWGTYIHGIFDNPVVLKSILEPFLGKELKITNYRDFKNQEYDKLASFVRDNIDMEKIYKDLQS